MSGPVIRDDKAYWERVLQSLDVQRAQILANPHHDYKALLDLSLQAANAANQIRAMGGRV